MRDLKRDGGAYLSDYDDEIRQAKECLRCSADFERKIAKAKCERDEWRSRCESLESTWLSAQVEAAAMREALEAVQDSPVITGTDTKVVWLQVSSATRKSISKALSLDAGKAMLERMRKAEELLRDILPDYELCRHCNPQDASVCDETETCHALKRHQAIDALLKGGEPRG